VFISRTKTNIQKDRKINWIPNNVRKSTTLNLAIVLKAFFYFLIQEVHQRKSKGKTYK
jgi:hypothetical protein